MKKNIVKVSMCSWRRPTRSRRSRIQRDEHSVMSNSRKEKKAEIFSSSSPNEGPTLRRQSQWPERHICERDAGTTTAGKCLRSRKIVPRKIHGKSGGSTFLENCGVPECEKGERARPVAHYSFLPAVVSARGVERALQQGPHVPIPPLPPPPQIKTTQECAAGCETKGERHSSQAHRVHTAEEIS